MTDLDRPEAELLARTLREEHPDAEVSVRPQPDGRRTVRLEPGTGEDGRHLAAATARLADGLEHAARQQDVDADLLGALCWVDCRFRDLTALPVRLFRFGRATWRGLVDRHGAALGIGESMIVSSRAQATMAAAQLGENARVLRNGLGRAAVAAELLLARLLGTGAALAMLRASPDEPADAPLRRFYAATPFGSGHVERVLASQAELLHTTAGQVRPVAAVTDVLHGLVGEGLREARRLYATARAALPTTADPPWLEVARRELGPQEIEGGASSRIEDYFAAARPGRSPDPVPWSGAFVGWCLHKAGRVDFGSPRAEDWLDWGRPLREPELGCVVVLRAQGEAAGAARVGFLAGADDDRLLLLGANSTDEVQVAAYRRSDLLTGGLRWPAG